jgi:hypothetical protein
LKNLNYIIKNFYKNIKNIRSFVEKIYIILVNYIEFRNRIKFAKDNIAQFIFCLEKLEDMIIILVAKKNKLEKKLFDIYNYIFYIKFHKYIIDLIKE